MQQHLVLSGHRPLWPCLRRKPKPPRRRPLQWHRRLRHRSQVRSGGRNDAPGAQNGVRIAAVDAQSGVKRDGPGGRTGAKSGAKVRPKRKSNGASTSTSQGAKFRSKNMIRSTVLGAALGAAMVCLTPISFHLSPGGIVAVSLDKAEARVGRPLTPGSVAGVNRRVHRRAYYGAAVGAAAVGAAATGAYYHRRQCGYYPYAPCY